MLFGGGRAGESCFDFAGAGGCCVGVLVCVVCVAGFSRLMRGRATPQVQFGEAVFAVDCTVPDEGECADAGKTFYMVFSVDEFVDGLMLLNGFHETANAIRGVERMARPLEHRKDHDGVMLRDALSDLLAVLEEFLESLRPESVLELKMTLEIEGREVVLDTELVEGRLVWREEALVAVRYEPGDNNNNSSSSSSPAGLGGFVRRALSGQERASALEAARVAVGLANAVGTTTRTTTTADLCGIRGLRIPRMFDPRVLRAMLARLLDGSASPIAPPLEIQKV